MSWTRRQFVVQAFSELGYASYVYDLESEQLQDARVKLDSMMATWNGRGIQIGYPLPTTPEASDLDDETQVPDWAAEAIYLNLAIRLAPTIGKMAPRETKVAAKEAMGQILQQTTKPRQMHLPTTLPAGAGNKPWRQIQDPFIREGSDNVVLPPADEVDFSG